MRSAFVRRKGLLRSLGALDDRSFIVAVRRSALLA